jgi:nitroreductase
VVIGNSNNQILFPLAGCNLVGDRSSVCFHRSVGAVIVGRNSDQAFDLLCARRKSVRAYTDQHVKTSVITDILASAAHAPSGGNMQPWQVHVLMGAQKVALSEALKAAYLAKPSEAKDDYAYYPRSPLNPYSERIKKAGEDLYHSVDIARRDIAARRAQQMRNYDFHGAPVGLILSMEAQLEEGSYVDMGIYVSHILLGAQSRGLGTCAAASFISYGTVIRQALKLPDTQKIICGIAMGYEDKTHPINQYERDRADMSSNVHWYSDGSCDD